MPKNKEETTGSNHIENLDDYLKPKLPPIPSILDNVLLVFSNSIPIDARKNCKLRNGTAYPADNDEARTTRHLMAFVSERLNYISQLEYALWLNGRLPFITPRELLLWRLRQYIEHIWAYQLPDDDDLALIFNTTKAKAAYLSADFVARFRKALLFPIALRRLYKILRKEDENYTVIDPDFEWKQAIGSTFKVPSGRYVLDANTLIQELRLRSRDYLRDAVLISKEDSFMWVSERVLTLAADNKIMQDILSFYRVPRESGYEG